MGRAPFMELEPEFSYLHTLTFKNPEPSYCEARRRWHSFRTNYLSRGGRFGVCVPQWGDKTKRLHFHLVTSTRWDAGELWKACDAYGFGRYDVRERPWNRAGYAARYVGRRFMWPEGLKGMRGWSVFGAKHFPIPVSHWRDVKIRRKVLRLVAEQPRSAFTSVEWRNEGFDNSACCRVLRLHESGGEEKQMREITKEQSAEVLRHINEGSVAGVGEYRSCVVEIRELENFKSRQIERRVSVSHYVDFGAACERRSFVELLPSGASEASVQPPAASGDLVLGIVDKIKEFGGETSYRGRVIRLPGQGELKTPAKPVVLS